ncbi:MAG: lipopolysaccharide transport periplasmic protein LptA [Betaproteobacteria bacterium]
MMRIFLVLAIAFFTLCGSAAAHAEKADRDQVMNWSSKQASAEGTKETNVMAFDGDVLMTQGTIRITAERAVVKQTGATRFAELFGASGKQVTFRQKREGESEFVDATADRAEYEDGSGIIRLFSKVHFKSGGDLVDSEYMQYNITTQKMELRNQVPGLKPKPGADGRVTFEIQPRSQGEKKPGSAKTPEK